MPLLVGCKCKDLNWPMFVMVYAANEEINMSHCCRLFYKFKLCAHVKRDGNYSQCAKPNNTLFNGCSSSKRNWKYILVTHPTHQNPTKGDLVISHKSKITGVLSECCRMSVNCKTMLYTRKYMVRQLLWVLSILVVLYLEITTLHTRKHNF